MSDPVTPDPAADPAPALSALVINLDRAVERMAHMGGALDRLGIAHERLAAVTPDQVPDVAREVGASEAGSPLTPQERACALSHMRAWQRAAEAPGPTLVLEDDVVFSADAAEALDFVTRCSDADLVRFEAFSRLRVLVSRHPVATSGAFELRRLHGRGLGAAAYMLSPAGARRLLRDATTLEQAVDAVLFSRYGVTGVTMQQLFPAIAVQTDQIPRLAPRPGPDWLARGETRFASQIENGGRAPLAEDRGLRKLGHSIRRKVLGLRRMGVPLSPAGPLDQA